MTTIIETTDGLRNNGCRNVSLKTITTELPGDWECGYDGRPVEREEALRLLHAVDVAMAEYKGRIAEVLGTQEELDQVREDMEAAFDAENYLLVCERIVAEGIPAGDIGIDRSKLLSELRGLTSEEEAERIWAWIAEGADEPDILRRNDNDYGRVAVDSLKCFRDELDGNAETKAEAKRTAGAA